MKGIRDRVARNTLGILDLNAGINQFEIFFSPEARAAFEKKTASHFLFLLSTFSPRSAHFSSCQRRASTFFGGELIRTWRMEGKKHKSLRAWTERSNDFASFVRNIRNWRSINMGCTSINSPSQSWIITCLVLANSCALFDILVQKLYFPKSVRN